MFETFSECSLPSTALTKKKKILKMIGHRVRDAMGHLQLFRERLSNKTVRGNAERYYV